MSKTDIEITIGKKFWVILFSIILFLVTLIFVFQFYDYQKKSSFYHSMYSAVTESPELPKINRAISKIDTSEISWMKDKAFVEGSAYNNNMQCLGYKNMAITDSILRELKTLLEKKGEWINNIDVTIEYGYFFIHFYTQVNDIGSCTTNKDVGLYWNSPNQNTSFLIDKCRTGKNLTESESFDALVEDHYYRVVMTLNNPRFITYIDATKYVN